MNDFFATPTSTRVAGFVFSIVMSTIVLGATVLSMQPRYDGASPQLVALERVTVSAPAVN